MITDLVRNNVAVAIDTLRANKLRSGLTILGVVIGVQGMVAMAALNHSIIRSFEAGLEAIAGTAKLQIAGPETGIPDSSWRARVINWRLKSLIVYRKCFGIVCLRFMVLTFHRHYAFSST